MTYVTTVWLWVSVWVRVRDTEMTCVTTVWLWVSVWARVRDTGISSGCLYTSWVIINDFCDEEPYGRVESSAVEYSAVQYTTAPYPPGGLKCSGKYRSTVQYKV